MQRVRGASHDRDADGDGEEDDSVDHDATTDPEVTTYGIGELRALWRAQVGYIFDPWGVALVVDGARRTSEWVMGGTERSVAERAAGLLVTLTY